MGTSLLVLLWDDCVRNYLMEMTLSTAPMRSM